MSLGFINPVGTGGVLDTCLCFGYSGVGGDWVDAWTRVVGTGLVSTSPAFVSSSASHPTGPHGRHAQKTVNRDPIAGGGKVRHKLHSSLGPPCRLEPIYPLRLARPCSTEYPDKMADELKSNCIYYLNFHIVILKLYLGLIV